MLHGNPRKEERKTQLGRAYKSRVQAEISTIDGFPESADVAALDWPQPYASIVLRLTPHDMKLSLITTTQRIEDFKPGHRDTPLPNENNMGPVTDAGWTQYGMRILEGVRKIKSAIAKNPQK